MDMLMAPVDKDRRFCGVADAAKGYDLTGYPFLYFPGLGIDSVTPTESMTEVLIPLTNAYSSSSENDEYAHDNDPTTYIETEPYE